MILSEIIEPYLGVGVPVEEGPSPEKKQELCQAN